MLSTFTLEVLSLLINHQWFIHELPSFINRINRIGCWHRLLFLVLLFNLEAVVFLINQLGILHALKWSSVSWNGLTWLQWSHNNFVYFIEVDASRWEVDDWLSLKGGFLGLKMLKWRGIVELLLLLEMLVLAVVVALLLNFWFCHHWFLIEINAVVQEWSLLNFNWWLIIIIIVIDHKWWWL